MAVELAPFFSWKDYKDTFVYSFQRSTVLARGQLFGLDISAVYGELSGAA